ncbi:MAG: nucleotidyltransferase [Thaumarchaeota archaeon]|nr:MAG: nucleotidyltransferase [Nitrososphaerota archaeon]
MSKEAIILAGGNAFRLKPHTFTPKPLLELKPGLTLLEYQVKWLRKHGFDHVVVASRTVLLEDLDVEWSLEREKLGTGGALKQAFTKIRGRKAYVMNVDDILLYDPSLLWSWHRSYVSVALVKARLPFGAVRLEGEKVVGFIEKPWLDFWVSAGHYVWDWEAVKDYLPDKGDLEVTALPTLAKQGKLWGLALSSSWYTINTYKDYVLVKRLVEGGVIPIP